MDIVVSFFFCKFYYICFIWIQGQLVCRKPFTLLREKFDSMQKSSKFLLEIMMIVASASVVVTEEVFSVGGMSFI
jgi:hypothetical protein